MSAAIQIVPYDQRWSADFLWQAMPLREALGEHAARIDHIGSTAVPGLAAKDVIDIQVTVTTLDAERLVPRLEPLGYTLRAEITADHVPPGWNPTPEEWRKLYFRAPDGQRRTHLHVRQAGRANQRYALLFRDYLRADPVAAATYAQVKTALARLHPNDADAYYAVKDPVCDIIMAAASRWAAATNYAPGSPDA